MTTHPPRTELPQPMALQNGWYWYGTTPVDVMEIGGIQVMRGYDFTTKEEYRTPLTDEHRGLLRPIPL